MAKKKRQRGQLQNIHTRIPKRDYQKISVICEKLNITFADYFNRMIHADGYDELQRYAKKIKSEPRSCKIEMDQPTKESIDNLSNALNSQCTQMRRIGKNLSTLIAKSNAMGTNIDVPTLTAMKKELDVALFEIHNNSSRLADILYDESTISKVEYRGHNIWDSLGIDIDAVGNEDWGEL